VLGSAWNSWYSRMMRLIAGLRVFRFFPSGVDIASRGETREEMLTQAQNQISN
jgi:hypothetical protein